MIQVKQQPKIIVSLTSYPKRIATVHLTITSLLKQSVKPNKIILWLAREQFSDKSKLPGELTSLEGDEFEICWCEDLKPHKKYYHTFLQYPEDCVITVDDDCIYPTDLVDTLYRSYIKYPLAVSTMRARMIGWEDSGELQSYSDWLHASDSAVGIPAMDLLPIGCGGVLYPPHIFSDEVFNREYITRNCLYADDLWLKIMHAVQMVPVVLASTYRAYNIIDNSQEEALWYRNSTDNNNIMLHLLQDYDGFRTDGKCLKDIMRGKYGTSVKAEIARRLREEKDRVYQLLDTMKTVIIYGAGFYGKKVLERMNAFSEVEVLCFVVSKAEENPAVLEGKAVMEIDAVPEYRKDSLVIVATDPKHHDQIIETLEAKGFNNYLLVTDTILFLLER